MKESSILEKIISDSGYSKTKFAKELGISKSFMFGVLNDTKSISEPMYNTLLSSTIVSDENKKLLEHKRFSNILDGEDNFNRVLYLVGKLNNFSDRPGKMESVYVRDGVWERLFSNSVSQYPIGVEDELYEIISYFCQKLFAHDKPFFYSNFSFGQKKLNQILYTIFFKRDYTKPLDFIHLVLQPHDVTNEKIDVIFESLKWGGTLLNTYVSTVHTLPQGLIFPYYIISNDCVIIFSENCRQGLVFTEKQTIEYYKKNLCDLSQYTRFCNFIRDDVELLDDYKTISYKSLYSMCGDMCCGYSIEKETFRAIAQDGLPQLDLLIERVMEHYNLEYRSNAQNLYHSVEALRRFASDGDLRFISDQYVSSLTHENRARVLENMKDAILHEEKVKYKLFDENKLNFSNIVIEIFHDVILITYNLEKENRARKEGVYRIMAKIKTAELMPLFMDLNEYMTKGNFFYPDDITIKVINELILQNTLVVSGENKST